MANKNGKDYIYLVWKDPKTREQILIGQLSKNGQYEFQYDFDIQKALDKGFKLLIAFDKVNVKYSSDKLFPTFSSRIPDRRRKDINIILNRYGLEEYNEYELLKKSGGRLPIDELEFIDPIIEDTENPIKREFYIAGPRHYLGCDGNNCWKGLNLKPDEQLKLLSQRDNEYDENAIKILNNNEVLIGYIPRYYNKELNKLINKGYVYIIKVLEYNRDKNCNECLRVSLELSK